MMFYEMMFYSEMNPLQRAECDALAKIILDTYDNAGADDTLDDQGIARHVAEAVMSAGWKRSPPVPPPEKTQT